MKREPIESDVIASIGYDPVWKVLEIEFRQTREIYMTTSMCRRRNIPPFSPQSRRERI